MNRGRRVAAGLLAAVAVGWGGVLLANALKSAPAPAPVAAAEAAPVVVPPAPKAKAKTAVRSKKSARRAPIPVAAAAPTPARPVEAKLTETTEAATAQPAAPADDAPAFAAFPGETVGAPPPMPPPEAAVAAAADDDLGNGEAIARAIAANQRAAVRDCFERELKADPQLHGTVAVELDLAPPNRIAAVRVSDDLERPAFTECVSAAMAHARFGALNEEVHVRVPYVLSPEGK